MNVQSHQFLRILIREAQLLGHQVSSSQGDVSLQNTPTIQSENSKFLLRLLVYSGQWICKISSVPPLWGGTASVKNFNCQEKKKNEADNGCTFLLEK